MTTLRPVVNDEVAPAVVVRATSDGYVKRQLEQLWSHDLRHRPVGDYFTCTHEHDPIGDLGRRCEVVNHHESGQRAPMHLLAHQLPERLSVTDVQMGRRLIEEQNRCLLRQRTGNVNPLLLATRECFEGTRAKRLELAAVDHLVDNCAIAAAHAHQHVLVRRSPHRNHLANGDSRRNLRTLVHNGNPLRDLARIEVTNRTIAESRTSLGRIHQTRNHLEQCRLSGSVRTEQRTHGTGIDREIDLPQHEGFGPAVSYRHAAQRNTHRPRVARSMCDCTVTTLAHGMLRWSNQRPLDGHEHLMATDQSADDTGTRIIKRYSNRKLYDTTESRYVTLQQIGEMVRAGEDVQIIDNKTKEDKTEVTLALILSEDLKNKPRSVPLGMLRNLIQERGERILSQLREGPIGRLIPTPEDGEAGIEGTDAAARTADDPERTAAGTGAAGTGAAGTGAAETGAAETGAAETGAPSTPDKPSPKGRFDELMESSKQTIDQLQASLDDRVKAVVPGLGLIRELREEITSLTQRVTDLEEKLAARDDAGSNKSN